MITDHQLSWLKEFLKVLSENAREADHADIEDVVESFRKLWAVARAAEANPEKRSPRLAKALDAIRAPAQRLEPGKL